MIAAAAAAPALEFESLLLTAGLVLLLGAAFGHAARLLRLPTLTGFLAAGIFLGPHGLALLPEASVELLSEPVNDLAMALVLFVLGGQFRWKRLRPIAKRTLLVSTIEALVTFALVALLALTVLEGVGRPLLLGILAVAVAPATTLLVLEEYGAEGPVSEQIKLLTALSNVWAILAFEIALLALLVLGGGDAGPGEIARDVLGSLFYGLVAGHALIVMQHRAGRRNYALPLLTVLFLTIGACQITGVPHMLAFLVTGAVVANRSRLFEPITSAMDAYAPPAFVAFFVLSGLHLDFDVLASNWLAVGLYVLGRTIGKTVGGRLGTGIARRRDGASPGTTPPVGLGLLCQAGAAIALAGVAREYDEALGTQLLNIVLGAVIVFELVGPVLVRHVALEAGELRFGQLLTHAHADERDVPWLTAIQQAFHGRRAPRGKPPEEVTASDLMVRGLAPLSHTADMDEILRYANHAPVNQLPVVDGEHVLVGLIDLRDLEELAYDPHAAALVIAGDLTSYGREESFVEAGAGAEEAAAFFAGFGANAAAVVDNLSDRRYLGMVERAEVLRVVRQFHGKRAHAESEPRSPAAGPRSDTGP